MASNSTFCPADWEDIFKQALNITVGIFAFLVNLFMAIVIIKNKQLRKETFILLSGLAIGYSFDGLSYFSLGAERLQLYLTCAPKRQVSKFKCMQDPTNNFFLIGESASTWMILFLSLDRMISATCTGKMSNCFKSNKFTYATVAFVALYAVLNVAGGYVSAYYDDTMVSSSCGLKSALPEWYYIMHKMHMIVCGFISVSCYVFVLLTLAHKRRTQVTSDSIRMAQIKREWKVTKTLSVIIMMTFIFRIIPSTLYMSELKDTPMLMEFRSYSAHIYCANDGWEMIFYAWKMTKLKDAIKETLCWWRAAPHDPTSGVTPTLSVKPAVTSVFQRQETLSAQNKPV